jgi:hypothetical protein
MNNQIIELLNSFKFHCEAYINQFKQLCEICEIPEQSELLGREQLYEYGTKIKKINGWHSQKYKAMENPYDAGQGFYRNIAAFDQFYYYKVDEVSINLINALNSYLLENNNHDAIKKLLRKDLDTYENFKDFECLNELGNFKTVIKLIVEQCDYSEINIESGTPQFKRIKELRKETEFYFKTDCGNVYGNDIEQISNIQHFQDKHNFQKKINSCADAKTLKAHLTETLRKWNGKKSQWIEYTLLSIAPPNSNNNVLVTSAWFEWFESHKEQNTEYNGFIKIYDTHKENDKIAFDKLELEANKISNLNDRIIYWSEQKKIFLNDCNLDTLQVSGFVQKQTGLNESLFLDRLIENEIKHLETILKHGTKNNIQQLPISNGKKMPTVKMQVLIAIYNNRTISKAEGNSLYNQYCKFVIISDRMANPESKRKYREQIKLFESVIELLEGSSKQKAIDEIETYKNKYKNEYE